MKKATYRMLDGTTKVVEYDPTFPCIHCGKPVIEASMGGTVVCPWCDSGTERPNLTDKEIKWLYEVDHGTL